MKNEIKPQRLQKCGNSKCLIVKKFILDALGWTEFDVMIPSIEGNKLVFEPMDKTKW